MNYLPGFSQGLEAHTMTQCPGFHTRAPSHRPPPPPNPASRLARLQHRLDSLHECDECEHAAHDLVSLHAHFLDCTPKMTVDARRTRLSYEEVYKNVSDTLKTPEPMRDGPGSRVVIDLEVMAEKAKEIAAKRRASLLQMRARKNELMKNKRSNVVSEIVIDLSDEDEDEPVRKKPGPRSRTMARTPGPASKTGKRPSAASSDTYEFTEEEVGRLSPVSVESDGGVKVTDDDFNDDVLVVGKAKATETPAAPDPTPAKRKALVTQEHIKPKRSFLSSEQSIFPGVVHFLCKKIPQVCARWCYENAAG